MGGPREDPENGFRSFPEEVEGQKLRVRSETFADHYSQARQFYLSQTETEQGHIASAFTFELSKVETPAIRARMVSHLLNVDADLARTVARGLRLKPMPKAADPAMPTKELEPSPKLSILLNGPGSFKGRKLGALVTDGVDIELCSKPCTRRSKPKARLIEIVSPMVGGVEASDGTWVEGKQMLGGGPSVLYDAVAVLASPGRRSAASQRRCGEGFRFRCLRPLQVHRLFGRGHAAVREGGTRSRPRCGLYRTRRGRGCDTLRGNVPRTPLLGARTEGEELRLGDTRRSGLPTSLLHFLIDPLIRLPPNFEVYFCQQQKARRFEKRKTPASPQDCGHTADCLFH